MALIDGFEAGPRFYDDVHFPRGFRKSGEFTIAESDILETYGRTLEALGNGRRTPCSSEEARMVKVCQSTAKPKSLIEKTWVKFLTKRGRRVIVPSFSLSSGHHHTDMSGNDGDHFLQGEA